MALHVSLDPAAMHVRKVSQLQGMRQHLQRHAHVSVDVLDFLGQACAGTASTHASVSSTHYWDQQHLSRNAQSHLLRLFWNQPTPMDA
jgi:hypothetical protein